VYPLRGLQLLLRRNIIRLFDIEKGKSSKKVFQKTTLVFLFVRRRYCHATWAQNGAIDLIIQGGQSNRRITVEKSKKKKKPEGEKQCHVEQQSGRGVVLRLYGFSYKK
jgi:hypothetical protein